MKITAIILLSAALQVSARGISQTVTLSVKDAPLEKVFTEIKKQTGYEFFYYQADLAKGSRVSLDVRNATLDQVLQQIFKEQPLTYTVIDRNIVIKTKVPNQLANEPPPPIDVKGRVVNENGEPVIATVHVKNGKNAVSTDENGYFLIGDVDEDAILVVSGVNIVILEVKVQGRLDVETIVVKTKITEGSAVVVNNGYQQLKPNEVTGSVVVITKEQLDQRIAPTILEKLEGITNGMVFNKNAGTGSNKIRIRGESTIFGYSEPLLIVDNFEYPIANINQLNPIDVETITILKDASASSIWGARAGNGVIVITTKSGKINQPLKIDVNANTTITEKPDLFYSPRISASDWIDVETYLFQQGRYNANLTSPNKTVVSPVVDILNNRRLGLISSADSALQIDALRTNDWRKEVLKHLYQTSVAQQYQISLSGGSNRNSYYLSVGFDKSRSTLIGDESSRITINNKNSFRPIKNFEANIMAYYTEQLGQFNGISELRIPNLFPYMRLADDLGNALRIPQKRAGWEDTVGNGGFLDYRYFPLKERDLISNSSKTFTTRVGSQFQYQFLKSFRISISYQYYRSGVRSKTLVDENAYLIRERMNTFAIVTNGKYNGSNYPAGGQLDLFNTDQTGHNGRAQLDYMKKWNSHSVSVIAGIDVRESISDGNSSRFYGYDDKTGSFIIPNLFTVYTTYVGATPRGSSILGAPGLSSTARRIDRFRSYFANASYTYAGRYGFTISGRLDQANIFGVNTNQKGTPLWSVGGLWDISKEKFYKSSLIPSLNLRLTYGYQGNISPDAVAATTIKYQGNALHTGLPFSLIDNYPNPELRWEKSGQLNIGLSFVLKNQLIVGSIEYFIKNGKDLFGRSPLDPTTGVSSLLGNFSDMKSTGVDLSLSSRNISSQNLTWSTTFIFNYAAEKVTRYDIPADATKTRAESFNTATPIVGYPLYSIFSFRWGGLNPTNGDPRIYLGDTLHNSYSSSVTNMVKLSDMIYNGRYNPPYYGSLYNKFTWKSLSLGINVSYKLGHFFRRSTVRHGAFISDWKVGHSDFLLRWRNPGDEQITNVPSFRYPIPAGIREEFYTNSDILVENADHVRLQFIDVSYSLNEEILRKLKIQAFRIHFYANNLGIIWRANKLGIDPDYPFLSYPPPRSYSVGINVTF